jgi:hypothetical protein
MLRRNNTILWRELDGEAVLLNPHAGCSYNLNQVGTLIWKMLDGTHASDEIASAICERYEVELEQALQDLEHLLADMHAHNLVSEVTSPTHPVA